MNTQTKRHCMIVLAFYPLAETRVQREAEALIGHGIQVDVICLRGSKEQPQEVYQGVQVHRLPITLKKKGKFSVQFLNYLHFFLLAMFKVTQLHFRNRYHSVQTHNLPDFLVFSTWVLKLLRVPVIIDLHDLMPEFFSARTGYPPNHWLVKLVMLQEKVSCRFADRVITVTDLWRQKLIARGVPEEKISVVMNVADERIFKKPEIPSPHRPANSQFRLVYHGTVTYRYGLDLAIQAINLVREDIPNINLHIIGSGDHLETLKQLIKELDLSEFVTLSGFIPAEKLPPLLEGADLGVIPYRNDVFTRELLPTKLMEYAVMGIPSISARTPTIEQYFSSAMVEFFSPGNVDELASAILKLYRDPTYRVQLAQNADGFNQRYNWSNIGDEYAGLIKSLHIKD